MNIRQLEAFFWIVQLGSFGAAADKLRTTQPAISARIKELEQSLGSILFTRGKKQLRPSAAGRALFPLAAEALRLMSRIQNSVGSNQSISGLVRIGMGEIVALTWFPAFLARLNGLYPSVQLEIFLDVSVNLNRMLDEGQLDLAFVVGPGSPGVIAQSVGVTPLRWMAAKAPAAPRSDIGIDALTECPIYTLSRSSHLHARVSKWLTERNIRPTAMHSCNSLSVIIKLVKLGCGVAMLPPVMVGDELRDGSLRVIETDGPAELSEFFLVRPRELTDPTISRICEMALETTIFEQAITRG
jgi:DNA-binding transcriptional LysR family regulator